MHKLKTWETTSVRVAVAVALAGIVVAALLLRTSAPSVTAEAPENRLEQRLTVDWRTIFVTPSETIDLEKGERSYSEADVFRVGDADTGTPIGEIKWSAISTEPPGVQGSLTWGVFRLFERGDIHVAVVIDDVDGTRIARGVITGGTGEFLTATGVYTDAVVGGGARATLTFSQLTTVAMIDLATIQGAITRYMRDYGYVALPSAEANDGAADTSTNDFSAATGILDLESVGPGGFPFVTATTTRYFYCWNTSGVVTVQDIVATLDCSR